MFCVGLTLRWLLAHTMSSLILIYIIIGKLINSLEAVLESNLRRCNRISERSRELNYIAVNQI